MSSPRRAASPRLSVPSARRPVAPWSQRLPVAADVSACSECAVGDAGGAGGAGERWEAGHLLEGDLAAATRRVQAALRLLGYTLRDHAWHGVGWTAEAVAVLGEAWHAGVRLRLVVGEVEGGARLWVGGVDERASADLRRAHAEEEAELLDLLAVLAPTRLCMACTAEEPATRCGLCERCASLWISWLQRTG